MLFEIYELVFELGQITFYIIAIFIKKTIKTKIKTKAGESRGTTENGVFVRTEG